MPLYSRRALISLLCLGLLPTSIFAKPAQAMEPDKLFETLSPSVVWVTVPVANGFSFGSGVVIAPETVITNCHVLAKGKSISVKTGHEYYDAKLQLPDVERDLCQITVPGLKAPPVKIVPTDKLRIGQRVYALGNPEGLELSFSDGLISGFRTIDGKRTVQTTAPIAHGSSGGGLFDDQGRLIGITSSGVKEGLGLNFAISADYIAELPKRGAAALASLKSKPAESNPSAPAAQATTAPSDKTAPVASGIHRKLTAEEILAQFSPGRELMANEDSNTSFSLKVLSNGRWVRRYCANCNVKFGDGQLELKSDAALACFNWTYVTYPDGGCYEVFQVSEASFRMESREGGRAIRYRMLN